MGLSSIEHGLPSTDLAKRIDQQDTLSKIKGSGCIRNLQDRTLIIESDGWSVHSGSDDSAIRQSLGPATINVEPIGGVRVQLGLKVVTGEGRRTQRAEPGRAGEHAVVFLESVVRY
jgi:hypothetical protein